MIKLEKTPCGLLVDSNAPKDIVIVLNNSRLVLEVSLKQNNCVIRGTCYLGAITAYCYAQRFFNFDILRIEGGQNNASGFLCKQENRHVWRNHYWLVLNDTWIVDPTIDQFDPKLPAVLTFPDKRYKASEQNKVNEFTAQRIQEMNKLANAFNEIKQS